MDINQAEQKLRDCRKAELQDHAFGDAEVSWFNSDGALVADGYFSRNKSMVTFETDSPEPPSFQEDDARRLRSCFTTQTVSRNDAGDDGL